MSHKARVFSQLPYRFLPLRYRRGSVNEFRTATVKERQETFIVKKIQGVGGAASGRMPALQALLPALGRGGIAPIPVDVLHLNRDGSETGEIADEFVDLIAESQCDTA